MWGWLELDDAVRDSDLIVVGTLSDVAECSWAGWDYGNGTISVKEVLWGDARAGDRLRLRWDNPSTLACPRVEHAGSAGTEYIWLLTRSADDSVRADHPDRCVSTEGRAEVLRSLAGERKTVCLRANRTRYSASDVSLVTLVFRNPSDVPATYPGVHVSGHRVTLAPGVRLRLYEGFEPAGPPIAPKPETLVGLGIWRLRVSGVSARGTVRRAATLVALDLAILAASVAIGHSATMLWSTMPILW